MSHDEHSAESGPRWPGIVGVCLVAYFLSPPMVLWVLSKFYSHISKAPEWLVYGLAYFYAPVFWLGQHVKVVGDFYSAYIGAIVNPWFIMMG